jgi:hypothetical protein
MEIDNKNELFSPVERAMRRAARGVLRDAVESNAPIPVWNGSEVIWEVPIKQLEQLEALESCSTGSQQNH